MKASMSAQRVLTWLRSSSLLLDGQGPLWISIAPPVFGAGCCFTFYRGPCPCLGGGGLMSRVHWKQSGLARLSLPAT